MFGRDRHDRGALVAFIAALIAIVFVAYLNQPSSAPEADKNATTIEQDAQQDVPQSVPSTDDFEFWEDTFPQWAMALFSIVATGISWLAVVYLRETLRETRKAVKAADDAVDVTREIGQAQVRAYLNCPSVEFAVNEMQLRCLFNLHNSGASPAKSVFIEAKLSSIIPTPVPGDVVDDRQIVKNRVVDHGKWVVNDIPANSIRKGLVVWNVHDEATDH